MRFFLFIPCVAFSVLLSAQSGDVDTTINLVNTSGTKEIPVQVSDGVDALSIVFEGEISEGSIEVKLLSPSGKRHGGFELGASSGNVVNIVSGSQKDREKSNSNSNSNTNSSSESEETIISISKGGNTTAISSGSNSVSISSGDGNSMSISSGGGVSTVKSYNSTGDQKGAKGVMVESIEDPDAGRWKIVLECSDATGEINLVISRG